MMKRFLVAFLMAILFASAAEAQSQLTRSQLESQINSTVFQNGVGAVTAAGLNTVLNNTVASSVLFLSDLGTNVSGALSNSLNAANGIISVPNTDSCVYQNSASAVAGCSTTLPSGLTIPTPTLSATQTFTAPSAAPSSVCAPNSFSTAFSCDLSHLDFAAGANITGTATLGEPASGYMFTPNLAIHYGYLANSSGWNQDTADNGGRTGEAAYYTKVDALGQGDSMAYFGNIFVNSAKSGATSFLANPAGAIVAGQVLAGQAGVFLQPIGDVNCNDEGFDVACVGVTLNQIRSVNTAALGETWIGYRDQCTGSKACDAGFSLSGTYGVGLDLADATYGTNQAGIAMQEDQKIYLKATPGANNYPQNLTLGQTYIYYSSSNDGIEGVSDNGAAFIFEGGGGTSSIFAKLDVTDTTASTSTTSGSGIFGGGIGVAGAGFFGGAVSAIGNFAIGATAGLTKTCSAMPTAMTITGGIITSVTGGTCT